MAKVYYEIDRSGYSEVSVDEFFDVCDRKEKNRLYELINNEILCGKHYLDNRLSVSEEHFEIALSKLHGKWNRLGKEEEDLILKLSEKF